MAHSKVSGLTLDSDDDMKHAARSLGRACADMRRVIAVTGVPPLHAFPDGFEGLASIITGQQLSAHSAAAIWSRTKILIRPFKPKVLLAKSEDDLRSAGLSSAKIRTLTGLAQAITERRLDLGSLADAPEDEVRGSLTAISGIGPWTANLYLLFSLRRSDAWAPTDLALQVAARTALRLDDKPDAKTLEALGERWRPWRGAAARVLWAWHAHPLSRGARESAGGEARPNRRI